jgi:small nuclear ribonucleoprotein (snRNP)-like protein
LKGAIKGVDYTMRTYIDDSKQIDFTVLVGKLVLCRKGDGREFVSKLVAIDGDTLIFSTRNGHLIENPLRSITYAAEV